MLFSSSAYALPAPFFTQSNFQPLCVCKFSCALSVLMLILVLIFASQTLCLAAYEKGISSVILGLFDDVKAASILELPEDREVAALIPMGSVNWRTLLRSIIHSFAVILTPFS